jgi:hypothetical protein
MEVLESIFNYLLDNYALYLVVMMGLLIMIINTVLMFVKKPIKMLTSKIPNEKVRKLANKMFILFAFGISALLWFVLSEISAEYFPFDEIKVLLTGAFSIVIHALGDGVITKSKAEQLIDTIKDIAEEGDNDQSAVAKFWKEVK